jgi:hypothetical protein
MWTRAKKIVKRDTEAEHAPLAQPEQTDISEPDLPDDDHLIDEMEKQARRAWKEVYPEDTIKRQRRLYETGIIKELPWMQAQYYPVGQTQLGLVADNTPNTITGEVKGFGTAFPTAPTKGNMFLRVDQLPSVLYKFNGNQWIEVDKSLSDQHAYNDSYIDHLIEKISSGEYDPELLSDAERDSIEKRLNNQQV